MTFDLTSEQTARLAEVRRLAADILAPAAADIDRSGQIPDAVARALDAAKVWSQTPFDAVLAIEELASACASAAARVALGASSPNDAGLAGLRGVSPVDAPTGQQQLAMAAVCLGIGRTALAETLAMTRERGDRPGGDPDDPPHWALADAATEMDAARLLVWSAAHGDGVGAAASLVFAGGAAARAVDSAIRIAGAEAYRPGAVLERCSRDIHAAVLILGTEDVARRQAADTLLA